MAIHETTVAVIYRVAFYAFHRVYPELEEARDVEEYGEDKDEHNADSGECHANQLTCSQWVTDTKVTARCHSHRQPSTRHDESVDKSITVEKVVKFETQVGVVELLDWNPGVR